MQCKCSLFLVAVLAVVCASAPARAQSLTEPDSSKARVRIGPLALSPTIELTNLGVDTNVFNEPTGQAKRDFTFTLAPKTDLWMKVGPTWITGNVREDIVWYQKYSSERAGNDFYTLNWIVPLNRLSFGATGGYLSTRDRPGFEIDARSQRKEVQFGGAAEYRALAKTYIGVKGSRNKVDYDKDAIFLNANLQFELNRTVTQGAITIRHQLTPLTAITLDAGRSEDRFEFSPLRDSNSTTVGVGVTFDPFALVKGTAHFGYRDFNPLSSDLKGYKGGTVALSLSYTMLGTTRLTVNVKRDIDYSYDVNEPYYLLTGVDGEIAQQIYGPLDVVVRAGRENLSYQSRTGLVPDDEERDDKVEMYGGGVGYHFGRDLRIGLNVDKQRRLTNIAGRRYDGLRIGTSVTYGF